MKDIDYHTLAETYQTPLYVYDLQKISSAFLSLKEAFRARKSLICYALKANSNLSIIHHLGTLGSGADCVSIGEVRRLFLAVWGSKIMKSKKHCKVIFYF